MALNGTGIATGIAALSIGSITIKDLDEIPVTVSERDCPIMFPNPDGWVGSYGGDAVEGQSTFTVATAYWEMTRQLKYVYLHCKAGTDRSTWISHYVDMTINADAITERVVEMDISGVDVIGFNIGTFGLLAIPSGDTYLGFEIFITVREKINA